MYKSVCLIYPWKEFVSEMEGRMDAEEIIGVRNCDEMSRIKRRTERKKETGTEVET